MPKEDNKILKYNHGEKSVKVPFIVYADLESLLEKMSTCHNNPNESSIIKINEHAPSGYSLFTLCSFYLTKNKLHCYRGKDCMKTFCTDLKEHTTKIIMKKKKKMIPSLIKSKKYVIYWKKDLVLKIIIKSIIKLEIIVTTQENIEELLIMFVI